MLERVPIPHPIGIRLARRNDSRVATKAWSVQTKQFSAEPALPLILGLWFAADNAPSHTTRPEAF